MEQHGHTALSGVMKQVEMTWIEYREARAHFADAPAAHVAVDVQAWLTSG